MIALLDYDSGNIRSVEKALGHVGTPVRRVRSAEGIEDATGVVLPGVGAFDDCMDALKRQGLLDFVRQWIAADRPFLGICVGYQALFERSEEFNSEAPGLGVFDGSVIRIAPTPEEPRLKVPQIGWNQVRHAQPGCPLFKGIDEGAYFYFVHSFHPAPKDSGIVATWTDYGKPFASSIWRGRTFATQFHPEKSQTNGLQLLKNFVDLTYSP